MTAVDRGPAGGAPAQDIGRASAVAGSDDIRRRPPIDGSAPKDMLNHAHPNLLCYRRVLQSRINSPAEAGGLSLLNGSRISWLATQC